MAESKIKMRINPPDVLNYTEKASLTSGAFAAITSDGEYLAVRAITTNVSGVTYASLLKDTSSDYIAMDDSGTGSYVRAVTPWIYIPKGKVVYARAGFGTGVGSSGKVLSAKPI